MPRHLRAAAAATEQRDKSARACAYLHTNPRTWAKSASIVAAVRSWYCSNSARLTGVCSNDAEDLERLKMEGCMSGIPSAPALKQISPCNSWAA